jgi:hypothetical protein
LAAYAFLFFIGSGGKGASFAAFEFVPCPGRGGNGALYAALFFTGSGGNGAALGDVVLVVGVALTCVFAVDIGEAEGKGRSSALSWVFCTSIFSVVVADEDDEVPSG